MASIKNLKKDLKNAIGEVIEGTLIHQIVNDAEHQDKANELIDESIREFDAMIEQINKKAVDALIRLFADDLPNKPQPLP